MMTMMMMIMKMPSVSVMISDDDAVDNDYNHTDATEINLTPV